MKVHIGILLGCLCLNSAATHSKTIPAQLGQKHNYEDATKLINVWLSAQKDYENIPSIMGVVVKDQKVLWRGAFGKANVEADVPISSNSLTSVCSTSKVFTATAIMKLVDDGKINLDDKVKDILPKYAVLQKFPSAGVVTVRSLLSHASGLPRDTDHAYWSGPAHNFPTETELFNSLSKLTTLRTVGSDIGYSNIGYALLGLIVEKASGMTYKDYLESNLFTPLKMSNSVVEMQSSTYGKQHAIGYTAPNRQRQRSRANFYQTKALQGASGISTSVDDMAKFFKWQFRLLGTSQTELMKASTLKSMYDTQASTTRNEYDRGFGYEVSTDKQGNRWIMHGGTCPGYVNYIKLDVTNKIGYAILVNANRVNTPLYVKGLIEILKRSQSANGTETLNENLGPELAQYTGFYDLKPWNSEYYVASWGEDLMLMYLPATSLKYALYQYRHVSADTFNLVVDGEMTDEKIEFIRDDHGRVIKVKNGGNYHSKIK